jgi:hypothetical protein
VLVALQDARGCHANQVAALLVGDAAHEHDQLVLSALLQRAETDSQMQASRQGVKPLHLGALQFTPGQMHPLAPVPILRLPTCRPLAAWNASLAAALLAKKASTSAPVPPLASAGRVPPSSSIPFRMPHTAARGSCQNMLNLSRDLQRGRRGDGRWAGQAGGDVSSEWAGD